MSFSTSSWTTQDESSTAGMCATSHLHLALGSTPLQLITPTRAQCGPTAGGSHSIMESFKTCSRTAALSECRVAWTKWDSGQP